MNFLRKNILTAFFIFNCFLPVFQLAGSDKPNVVLIVLDDLNDYLGVMGGHPQALTPNLDKLAGEGILFSNAHSNAPICAPSRSSFLTGILPSTSKNYAFDKWHENEVLVNSKTLMEYMADNGYKTFKTGKLMHHPKDELWDDVRSGQYHGPVAWNGMEAVGHPSVPEPFRNIGLLDGTFASLNDVPVVPSADSIPGYTGWWNHNTGKPFKYNSEDDRDKLWDELSVEWFQTKVSELENQGDPFLLAVGLMRPHTPLVVPQKYYDLFPVDSVKIPVIMGNDSDDCKYDEVLGGKGRTAFQALTESYTEREEGLRNYLQAYLASVAFADDMVGQLLAALDNSSLKENTIVVLFSDHGYHLGEKDYLFKNSLWEESTRIPLIIRMPGSSASAGLRVRHPVSLIDVYPTISDLCGLKGSTKKDEKGAALDGYSLKPFLDDPGFDAWQGPNVALSMVANYESEDEGKQNYSVRSENYRYVRYWNGSEELYDHTADSYEWTNVADDSTYSRVKNDLKNALFQLVPRISRVTDPLNDFSLVAEHSLNLKIDTVNAGNFNGDEGRCVRTKNSDEYLVYDFEDFNDFSIEFWIVDSISGEIEVYLSEDGNSYTLLKTKIKGPVNYGYRYLETIVPDTEIPAGIRFLKIVITGSHAWKGQIGSVSFFNPGEKREVSSTFYVDSETGSDFNSGTTPGEAWRTLERANEETCIPGDSLLLKSGQTFFGSLKIAVQGTKELPLFVGKFGGNEKPVINSAGYLAGIQLSDAKNIHVHDLEITSDGEEPTESEARTKRYGVYVTTAQPGEYKNFEFKNLYIHDIFASENIDSDGQNPTSNMGMGFSITMTNKSALLKDVLIEDCTIEKTGHTGIRIFGAGDAAGTAYLDSVSIINNYFEHIGGPGMVPGRCSNVVVRGNIVNYSGSSADLRMHNRGSGIWPWTSKNVLIEKNKFMHAYGKHDSCGAHIDFNCSNVVIQYNLSFDNAGGFVEILGNDHYCIYRYNISINDGYRKKGVDGAGSDGYIFWISNYTGKDATPKGASNSKIYNNTIYVGHGIKTGIKLAYDTRDNRIENNIIVVDGEMDFLDQGENNSLNNNLYYGNIPKLPFGDGALFCDPELINPGDTLPESYRLKENSPAINTGEMSGEDYEFDFWGDTVVDRLPVDRGADESVYNPAHYNVFSSSGEGGNIYPNGNMNFPEGINLPYIISPAPGYVTDSVLVDGELAACDSVYLFPDLSENHSIYASFFAPADSVTDPLNNLEITSFVSTNMVIQNENPVNFSGDAGRAQRINTAPGFLIYNFKEIEYFEVAFWGVNDDDGALNIYISENGEDYTLVTKKVLHNSIVNLRYKTVYSSKKALPEGINYLKFELVNSDAGWKAQIGSVTLKWLGDERIPVHTGSLDKKEFMVYPNPVEDLLSLVGTEDTRKVKVINLNGKVIALEAKRGFVDVSQLQRGMYFLEIEGFKSQRFVKK